MTQVSREGLASQPSADRKRCTGGEAIAAMLKCHGVDAMFGMGGFQLLPLYEGIRKLGLEHYLTDDERSGAFAVDAHARVTNRPGVCDATLGPGATNLVTALVESLNAGIPVVALVGDVHREHSGKNMTQEARQLEILRPAVKEVIRIEVGLRIPELVRRAFAVATSGKPGPVVLAVPEDVSHGEYTFSEDEFWAYPWSLSAPAWRTRPDPEAVEAAAELLSSAKRPVILAGGGVHLSSAADELLVLAEAYSIPVAHTISGKGSIACTHTLSIGLCGRYSRIANDLIQESDCILVVGCKLGEIATRRFELLPRGVPIIQLDSSAEELGRTSPIAIGLWSDAKLGLADLTAHLASSQVDRAAYVTAVVARKQVWAARAATYYESEESPLSMARLIGECNALLPADVILVTDGGFASHWAGLLYDTKQSGRGFIADRGFASIGYGLAGAIGARLAAPDRPVVGITGDGGLNMTVGGLETARRIGAAFTLIVINNAASGYVKALQHQVYGSDAYQSSDFVELNYAELARAFGCHGIRVERPSELGGALKAGLANSDSPTVIDVVVTRDPGEMLPGVDTRTLRPS